MTDHPTRGIGTRKVLAGALALLLGMACLFAMLAFDAGSGMLAMALAVAGLAFLVTGTLSIGATEPGQVM
jgi:hypothetical protein